MVFFFQFFLAFYENFHFFRQVCLADLLILNKTDMSSEETLKKTKDVIRYADYYTGLSGCFQHLSQTYLVLSALVILQDYFHDYENIFFQET